MTTLNDIKRRATALSKKLEAGSITPEEVGQLIIDLSDYTQGLERDSATLGIRKVYPTIEAMQADTAPVGDNGKPLRKGNLVAIYQEATAQTDTNSGLVSLWTGSGWVPIARIGTAMRHEYTSIESRVTDLERVGVELQGVDEGFRKTLETLKTGLRTALERLELTSEEREKIGKLKIKGKASDYLGADGSYHTLPIQSVELNGVLLEADAKGKITVKTPQGKVRTFTLNGTRISPDEAGDLALGLQLTAESIDRKRTKVSLVTTDGRELSSIELLKGGGQGGGFLNLTSERPLKRGYYSLATALVALKELSVDAEQRPGLIITFESAEGKWADYRYVGTAVDDTSFYSQPLWRDYAKEVTDEHIKELIDKSDKEVEVAETIDDTNRPVASSAVKQAVEELRDIKLDSDVEATDEGSKVTLSRNGQQVAEFVVAGGGGGGQAQSTKAVVSAKLSASRIKLGDSASLNYGYTHYSDGEVDGVPAALSVTIRRGAQLLAELNLGQLSSGATGSLDLSRYLTTPDAYSILVLARYEEDGVIKERKAQAVLSVVQLSIELYNKAELETYLAAGGYKDGDLANIILSVRGGARSVAMYLDGDSTPQETKALSGAGSRTTFSLPLRSLKAGRHSLQFVAAIDELTSNSIYLDILKAGGDEPFVGLLFSRPDGKLFLGGEQPVVLARQYERAGWEYIALSRKSGGVAQLSYKEGARSTQFATPRSYQRYSTRYTAKGSSSSVYELEGYKRSFSVEVLPSTLEGVGIKEGAILELLAAGRSNIEAKPAQWTSGSVRTSFEGVDWRSSGWTGEALQLLNGAKARISYQPFATDAKVGGITLSMELRLRNVRSYEGAVVSCYDPAAHKAGDFGGFLVSAEKIKMPTGGSVSFRSEEGEEITRELGLEAPFDAGDYYSITLVVHPSSEQQTIRCYINGVLSKADTYQDTVFRQRTPQGIVFDSSAADLELRSLRIYTTALTDDEVLDNYITDRPTYEEMEALRDRNDVLSPDTGEPSWDKLYKRGKALLSISLEGGSLEQLWGKSTDTKTRYKVKELIFRSPYGRAYDLKVVDAAIRRQGTSTSTYPIKNLRIELQRKGYPTKVYRNTGKEGSDVWELVEARNYTMRPGAKPMTILNLKTDYADSSLCYNTGGAILLNDYLIKANPKLRTPGMIADSTARMAIDGLPIDVFTSATPEGDKRYCGQFQLNNDKSKSGALFGQTKKDGTEIALEFINNTNPVANFAVEGDVATQLASKGSDGFDASVEFLYPESDYLWTGKKGAEDTAPEVMKQAIVRLWGWVQSCVPQGADPAKMSTEEVKRRFKSAKFKSEVAQYFSVEHLALWWVWTDYCMSVDQRVKNTFWRTWDGLKWYVTYYDGDTAFGIRNDAFLAYLYNISRDSWDAQRSKYAFEGRGSRLWALVIANLDTEIKELASLMRTALTDDVFLEVFDGRIMGNWSERQYNKSQLYKYVKPTYTDYNGGGTMNYIFALKGTMQAYRRQLIRRRFSLLDARYEVGAYHGDAVTGYIGKGATPTQIKATAGDEYYFGWRTQNGQFRQHQRVETGGIGVFDFDSALSQNDPVRLVGASRMRRIDFATTSPYLQGSWNFNGCPILEELIAPVTKGSATQWYPLLSKITGLKRIDLTGQVGITGTEDEQARTFDVSSHPGLQELLLSGTAVRAVRIAEGAPITRLDLPATLSYLRLRALPKLTESGLQLADWSSVRSLELAACPLINWRTLVDKCTMLEALRVEGVDMVDDGKLLERLMRVRGLAANGSGVATCSLVGRCQLTTYIDDELLKRYQEHFPELDILQPPYTVIEFDETVDDPANISNLDNRTGYKYGNKYEVSGHIGAILKARHACLGKQATKGVMHICKLHDYDLRRYADNVEPRLATEALLDGSQGDVWVYEPRYWYKGVNDVLRHKKYACYAYGRKPPSPEGKRVTIEEIKAQGGYYEGKSARSVGNDASAFMFTDAAYSVIKVPVKGWARVRFPAAASDDNKCAIFCDASGAVIERIILGQNDLEFCTGMYLVKDVPQGAETLYTNLFSEVIDDFVWLTNSSDIVDVEPDWVEHKPQLVALFCPSMVGGRISSAVKYGTPERAFRGATIDAFEELCSRRGFQFATYNTNKDIINLGLAKLGTRDLVQVKSAAASVVVSGLDNCMLPVGFQDPYLKSTQDVAYMTYREGRLVEEVLTPGRWTEKFMGYEGFYSMTYEILGGLNIAAGGRYYNAHYYNRYRVVRQDGAIQIVKARRSYWVIAHVYFGRYMDVLPVSGNTERTHNNTQRYRDRCNLNEVLEGIWYTKDSVYRPQTPEYIGPLWIHGASRNIGTRWPGEWHSIRLEYNGEIKLLTSAEEFKGVQANI